MRNVSDKCVEKIKTQFAFVSPENRAIHEIMRKNIVEPDRPQMTIWRIRFASWILKDTNTHSEYIVLFLFHTNNGYTKKPEC